MRAYLLRSIELRKAAETRGKSVKISQENQAEQQSTSMKSETWGAPFKCMICGELHSDKLHLGQHFETHHAGRSQEAGQQVSAVTPEDDSKPSTSSAPSVNTAEFPASSTLNSHSLQHVNVPHASYTSTPIRGPGGQILGWIRTPIRSGGTDVNNPASIFHHQFSTPLMSPLVHGPSSQYSRLPTDIVYKEEPDEYVSDYFLSPSYPDPLFHHHSHSIGHPPPPHGQHQLSVPQHQHTQQPLQAQSFYYGNPASYETRPGDYGSASYGG
ncbi:uncharacterized protein LOC111253422 isoform X1 [Varroa destructor]|uniref:C2H2-type domain-containing protein n=1 Tax=Varroa destructor TaxID=109461 RepID=A0A7M7MIU5_VARDE|nr:uncharacterized protein LOC111253422 isoform X1 [Varroa destructor]